MNTHSAERRLIKTDNKRLNFLNTVTKFIPKKAFKLITSR